MPEGIRNAKDFFAGLLFFLFGLAGLLIGRGYPFGTPLRMGPGFFPTVISALLAAIGVAVAVRSFAARPSRVGATAWKPLLLVSGAVLVFALSVETLGIVVATVLLVLISCLANPRFHAIETTVLALVLAALAVGLFSQLLGLPFKLLPAFDGPAR